jgi:hypothetical protein
MKQIRKISVGDNLKDSIHYQVGKPANSNSDIKDIVKDKSYFNVYIITDDEVQLWKSFQSRVVCHIEYILD